MLTIEIEVFVMILSFKRITKMTFQAMFALRWIAFAPARKSYRIGLLLTHKNGDFGAISVTKRSCAAPIVGASHLG